MPEANDLIETVLPVGKNFFTEGELAQITTVPKQRFKEWRYLKRDGPSFVKLGRAVKYPREAVKKWLKKNLTLIGS